MESGTILAILVGILAFSFLGLAIFLGIFLYRRRKARTVKFNIIGVDGQIQVKRLKNPSEKSNKIYGKRYLYDKKAELRDFWGINMFYKDGNPNAIIFGKIKDENPKLSAGNISKVMEDNFISKLFSPAGLMNAETIFGLITMLLGIAVLYFLVIENVSVNLIASPENTQIIANACRQAFTSGVASAPVV